MNWFSAIQKNAATASSATAQSIGRFNRRVSTPQLANTTTTTTTFPTAWNRPGSFEIIASNTSASTPTPDRQLGR